MPYSGKVKEEQIKKSVEAVVTVGDLNLAYTVHVIIPMWMKEQRYSTIHAIRKVLMGEQNDEVRGLVDYQISKKGFKIQDIRIARMNAYDEFWRRVGQYYEDSAIEKNGDVYAGVPFADKKASPLPSLVTKRTKKGGK